VPFKVGLTGGIGSGKSVVEQIFRELGVEVIDMDAIAHALTGPDGLGMPAIRTQFGADFINPDGGLNRSAMRRRVFDNIEAKRQLEAILHPMIRAESDNQLRRCTGLYAILAIPLLVESGIFRDRVDRVLVVDCSEEQQITRTMKRSKLSKSEVETIMTAQADRKERLRHADDIILNNGGLAQLPPAVAVLDKRFQSLASARVSA
jgi:dephospho-CoA kinase